MVIQVTADTAGSVGLSGGERRRLERFFKGMEQQIPKAQALALTKMVQDGRTSLQGHLKGVLDRPTSRTLRGVRYQPAEKNDKPITASLYLVDDAPKGTAPADYLAPLIEGGPRKHKRHEKALHRAGILPRGWFTVPGKDVRLNKHGNITAGTYTKILSELRASPDPMQNVSGSRRSQAKRRGYFVMRKGTSRPGTGRGEPIGVYQRTGKRTVKSILHFISDTPTYTPRIDLAGPVERAIERRGRQHIFDAMTAAFRSEQKRRGKQQARELDNMLRGVVQGAARQATGSL